MVANTSRRSFITSVAAGLGAAPALALPALATSVTPENSEVLTLGAQIEPLLRAYRTARARKLAARKMAENLCPKLPDILVRDADDRELYGQGLSEGELDIEGGHIELQFYVDAEGKKWARPDRQIFQSAKIKDWLADYPLGPRSKEGKRLRQIMKVAEEYEAGKADALERSGMEAADTELYAAEVNLEKLAYRLRDLTPTTIDGVIIFARAMVAFAETETGESGFYGKSATVLGPDLSRAVLRISGHPVPDAVRMHLLA